MSQLIAMFAAVFFAELGDKTQLATVLFASSREAHPIATFLAAAGALTASTALAVFAGHYAGEHLAKLPLKLIAGAGFVLLGLWTLYGHFTEV
ncbi:TMEM165/GDT1 family protein [Tepidicaulis sp. LMO-SS28]|uniref:TMEM165/GDT1 family protein n=1 Tax=Tepidicaulis sp. LMO-SS28 TaxID=3447455 RepID=UPI003EE035D4